MQQDCEASTSTSPLDCTGPLSLIVLNHEWDADNEWTAKALFSGFLDPYRFRLAHELAAPAPTVFAETYPPPANFTMYRQAEARPPSNDATFWQGAMRLLALTAVCVWG